MASLHQNHIDIDFVFTWVNGNDPLHQEKINSYIDPDKKKNKKSNDARFKQVNEIEFAVHSILKNAPFVRTIFIVTDQQTPDFLKNPDLQNIERYKKVKIVEHKEIFRDYEKYLPTFNARTIETFLYRIPGLAEHFIYINDDFFILNPVQTEDFFQNGFPVLRGKWLAFEENLIYKKILHFLHLKKENPAKAGHKIAQQKAAKIVGFTKYYKFHHTPHPMRKSTFENFSKLHTEYELNNIEHKFRSKLQYTPQGLANHLEIEQKTCVLKSNYQLVYFGSYDKPLWFLLLRLKWLSNMRSMLFLNMQNLSACPETKLHFLLQWLRQRFD